jgi:flagellar hook assembly protein FlgD
MEIRTQTITVKEGYSKHFNRNGTSVLTVDFERVPNNYLGDAYPNPSHDKTTFTINLISVCRIHLEIINLSGKLVKVLVDNELNEGVNKIEWDNRTSNGYKTEPGIYFYRLRSNGFLITKSLVIL